MKWCALSNCEWFWCQECEWYFPDPWTIHVHLLYCSLRTEAQVMMSNRAQGHQHGMQWLKCQWNLFNRRCKGRSGRFGSLFEQELISAYCTTGNQIVLDWETLYLGKIAHQYHIKKSNLLVYFFNIIFSLLKRIWVDLTFPILEPDKSPIEQDLLDILEN